MTTATVVLPEEALALLARSRLRGRPADEQVRAVVATHLFLEGLISIGKAAELAGEPRLAFERRLVDLGFPTVRYEAREYEDDLAGQAEAERRARAR